MFWLSILDNQFLHVAAETAVIVIGSVLMGIFLAYFHWGGYKKRVAQLNNQIDFERNQVADLNQQIAELANFRNNLAGEVAEERNKNQFQSKRIYDLQQKVFNHEGLIEQYKASIEKLNATLKSYEDRMNIIEQEFLQPKEPQPAKRPVHAQPLRINYDHVSKLLGRQVTENDLTIIAGIGPRTASLLEAIGVDTWDILGKTDVAYLRQVLDEAGGVYKSLDPVHWPKQAVMASLGEWRKLRVFQATIRKTD